MSLRYIAQIGQIQYTKPLSIPIPEALRNIFGCDGSYKCEIARWWSKDRSKQLDIKKSTTLDAVNGYIYFAGDPVCRKYGFVTGDHLEIFFIKKIEILSRHPVNLFQPWKEWEEKVKEVEVFPERVISELLFDPDQGYDG